MKYKYHYSVHSIDFEETWEFESEWSEIDPERIAGECAEDYFWNHDGREDDWPIIIMVWMDNGYCLGGFKARMETVPEFIAEEIKEIEERTSCAPRQESVNCSAEDRPPNKPQHETALK